MAQKSPARMQRCLFYIALTLCCCPKANAQRWLKESHADFFCGVDFNYRDITHNKVYDILLNLTPGAKWFFPRHWQANVQVLVPVYNDYGDYYKRVRLNVASISKEWHFGERLFLKGTGGLFTSERYGIDVKAMYVATEWLALRAQAGVTGFCSMATGWTASRMERVTGTMEADFYLPRWNTEFRLRAGRYIYEDYGATAEAMRHFTHCTVGVFGEYSDQWEANAGFKVVMMIPPYRRRQRAVNVRPASNFRLTNNFSAEPYAMQMYDTDPEENEREGWFCRDSLRWGVNNMTRDFEIKGREAKR